MRHALAIARRGLGTTAPNPSVGAVLAREAEGGPVILARGRTAHGGRPHAERLALDAAGGAARGATLAVTLEPCAHHGRTPPCADAVVAAGVARVVAGIADPDPRVAGQGFARLRAAGIEVREGVLAREAFDLHLGHLRRATRGRPAVRLKLARTADGFAAGGGPERLMITGETANGYVHLLRARAEAVMIGAGTARLDDPRLTPRLAGLKQLPPLRVVLDAGASLSTTSNLARTAREAPVLVIAGEDAPSERVAVLEALGVEVARVPRGTCGLDLSAALSFLAARGVTEVLCEGGPTLADALARADLADEIILLTGPGILGAPGLPALGPSLAVRLADGSVFESRPPCRLGWDRAESFLRWT